MRTILTILLALMSHVLAIAANYSYAFNNTPVSEAIVRISKDHPDVNISFIYKELDNYKTSAKIRTNDPYDALRQIIGFNPIKLTTRNNGYYIEALQKGILKWISMLIFYSAVPKIMICRMSISPDKQVRTGLLKRPD